MKILFDEGVPKQLRRLLARDDITLVEEKGWKGIKNGRLLQLAEEVGFDVLITADQNLKWMPLLIPALAAALSQIQAGVYLEIPLPPELN